MAVRQRVSDRLHGSCDGVEMMDNELYCPMKMTSNPLGRCVCEKEKCAWWLQLDGCCAVCQIAWKIDGIEMKMKR